ncbi:CHAT domain-containing protein [Gymnopilus junonius]|uniref:CHAT domain-containing protein n=1 Tax=Gymnopilus junonius TaxID=109634 RepID=A0A9P5THC6_GYMJU|nr:CHAT domain-containing protein [Gymnopilus junonius]
MDYVVSSYVPTLGALVNSFQESSSEDFQQKFLAVVQPQTLPSALEELKRIEKPSKPATISSVLEQLSSSSIVHFACHGTQNVGNPLESALILEDGELTLSRIMQVEMKDARLAFLAACETVMGEKEVPDESMHLGAALLFAGFQSVRCHDVVYCRYRWANCRKGILWVFDE